MRYTITSQHLDYIRKEGHIEFVDFYNEKEASALRSLLDEVLSKNPSGRDLERYNSSLFKAAFFSRLAQVASALFNQKRLKLAFTQYYPHYKCMAALEDISSVTEICGVALVNLSETPLPEFPYLPLKMGDLGFYQIDFPIDFTDLEKPVFLIAFSTEVARYKFQEKDPETHILKKLGYAAGDRLRDETHPLLIK